MAQELTTLNGILDVFESQAADQSLVFETAEGEIGGGYHVTELKQVSITSIDCGGNLDDWRETHVQLLDGQDGQHMSTKKFAAIANRSMIEIRNLGAAPLYFEFALKNKGLRRYQVESLTTDADQTRLLLSEGQAKCKPASAGKLTAQSTVCCGAANVKPSDVSMACCG